MAQAAQKRLPGVEDPEIEDLVAAAEAYVIIRDKRMKLTPLESEAKVAVLEAMHKHKRKKYVHDGIEIEVIAEEETVKVRVKKDDDEEEQSE